MEHPHLLRRLCSRDETRLPPSGMQLRKHGLLGHDDFLASSAARTPYPPQLRASWRSDGGGDRCASGDAGSRLFLSLGGPPFPAVTPLCGPTRDCGSAPSQSGGRAPTVAPSLPAPGPCQRRLDHIPQIVRSICHVRRFRPNATTIRAPSCMTRHQTRRPLMPSRAYSPQNPPALRPRSFGFPGPQFVNEPAARGSAVFPEDCVILVLSGRCLTRATRLRVAGGRYRQAARLAGSAGKPTPTVRRGGCAVVLLGHLSNARWPARWEFQGGAGDGHRVRRTAQIVDA